MMEVKDEEKGDREEEVKEERSGDRGTVTEWGRRLDIIIFIDVYIVSALITLHSCPLSNESDSYVICLITRACFVFLDSLLVFLPGHTE